MNPEPSAFVKKISLVPEVPVPAPALKAISPFCLVDELALVVVFAVSASLFGLMSGTVDITEAMSLMTMPGATVLFTRVSKGAVKDAPTASAGNVTVRLLPLPPQTPEPVDVQATKVVSDGRLLVRTIDEAATGPLFVTVTI